MAHGARTHAKYSASNAHRWLSCHGQVALASRLPPRPDSEFSEEGTRFHELLQQSFNRSWAWRDGADPAMIAAVEVVHDWLESLYIQRGSHLILQIEQPFVFPQSVVPPQDCAGIADIMIFDPVAREAWSVDAKYGEGVVVEPDGNEQLLFNATGRFWQEPLNVLHCVIIQPRIPHHPRGVVRTWTCGPLELAQFQMRVERALQAAESVETFSPGPWCRWCPAEATCPTREQSALALAYPAAPDPRALEGMAPPDPKTLGLDRVAFILRHADMLKSWLTACENYAKECAMRGIPVPAFKLAEAQARRRWNGDAEKIAADLALASGLPMDTFFPRELIGVTEAEKLLVRAARDAAPMGEKDKAAREARERMAFLTLKQSSGNLVLVPDTDARPAADRASVAFKGVSLPPLPPR